MPPGSGKIASVQKPKEALLDDRKNSPIWLSDIQMRPNFSTPAGQPPLKLCATPPSQPEKRVGAELLVSVIDHSGAAIRDLKQPDFVVYSESQRFQIDSFASSGAPTSIVLAIDSSGSMQSKLENVQKTLTTFLNDLNACDEVAIIAFTGGGGFDPKQSIVTIQPFTTDKALASSRLNVLKPYGQTPLYDAVDRGLHELSSGHYPSRALVVITDGIDNDSASSKDMIMTEVKKEGWPMYAVGIGDRFASTIPISLDTVLLSPGTDRVDATVLNQMAKASGGQAFIVPPPSKDEGALGAAMNTIAASLGNEYRLGLAIPPGTKWNADQPPLVQVPSYPDATIHVQVATQSSSTH